jgi:hypothetical protein
LLKEKEMKQLTRLVYLTVAILCGFVLWRTSLFPPALKAEPLGPGFFPILLSCSMLALLVPLWLENRKIKEDDSFVFNYAALRTPSFFAGASLVFALLLSVVGFFLCAVAFLLSGMLVCGVAPRRAISGSLLITVSVYVIFKMLLQVALPAGSLWGKFL